MFSLGNTDRMAAGDAVYTEGHITNGGTLGFMDPIAHGSYINSKNNFHKFLLFS